MKKGSAQCKSSVIFGGMKVDGKTIIKAKNLEIIQRFYSDTWRLPIKIKRKRNFDIIQISKVNRIKPINYKIPSDISSESFIALTVLSKKSKLIIKNVNVNPTRIEGYNFTKNGSKIFI